MTKKERAVEFLRRLRRAYASTGPFVDWRTPLELVIATVLSAQCTDVRVNLVTKKLFQKYQRARDYAQADIRTLEKEIYSTGFYKSKARYLKGIGLAIEHNYHGTVPDRLEDLLTLPGVSHKSAHLIMAKAFYKNTGIAVDTHVLRVAPRLGFTTSNKQRIVERDLEKLFPPRDYLAVNEYMITHGRAVCTPRIPHCSDCVLRNICPAAKKFITASSTRERQ